MYKLLIVDDHILFREGLSSLLRAQPDFEVLGEAGSVREAIALARQLEPNLILLDFSLPDGTGLEAAEAILGDLSETMIVFLTMHEDDERLFAAIRAGAKGYLVKNLPVNQLLTSLRGLAQGEAPISSKMTSRILDEFSRVELPVGPDRELLEKLTAREMEILKELVSGGTNREIAYRLFISENTVKNHIHSILEKLGVSNRREAARFAQQHGIK